MYQALGVLPVIDGPDTRDEAQQTGQARGNIGGAGRPLRIHGGGGFLGHPVDHRLLYRAGYGGGGRVLVAEYGALRSPLALGAECLAAGAAVSDGGTIRMIKAVHVTPLFRFRIGPPFYWQAVLIGRTGFSVGGWFGFLFLLLLPFAQLGLNLVHDLDAVVKLHS